MAGRASASQPGNSAQTARFRQQEGLSEDRYAPVYVSHVYSPGDFFLNLRGSQTSLKLEQLMYDLEHVYEGRAFEGTTIGELAEGLPCAAPFTYADGHCDWHRAVVTSLNCETNMCRVFYVDYGTRGTVARTRLRALEPQFFELPTQAIRATLAGVGPAAPPFWTAESTAFFQQLVGDDKVFMCKLVGQQGVDKFSVLLCDVTPTSDVFVHELLLEEGHAVPLENTEGRLGASSVLPQPAFPVRSGICAAAEPPMKVRSNFGRGRAPPPATAAPVNCVRKTFAIPDERTCRRLQPPSPAHRPPVPAATQPRCISAVASGVASPAAMGPSAPSGVQVASVGGAAGPVGSQQQEDDDMMRALREALDEDPSWP